MSRVFLLVALLVAFLSLASAQTNLITNGNFEQGNFNGWMTPQGVNDTGIGAANRLRVFTYSKLSGGTTAAPNGWAYDGLYSALWESSSLNQSIVQTVAVTGGAQYLLSFFLEYSDGDTTSFLQVSASFNDGTNVILLNPTGQGAQQSYCSGSAAAYPPFWWSQFKFTVTAPTAATAMNLTFYGYDSEYGFLVDTVTMYAASGNSQPNAPPSTPVVPSGNLLVNGNFETGSVAPWREAGGDNPYGLSGSSYSGEGAYNFNGFAGNSGIPCPEGNYCFTFGAPAFSLPIQQTVAVPSTSSSYTLSFQWYSPGGYNSSQATDLGSALIVGYAWNSGSTQSTSGTVLFQVYNTTAVTTAQTAQTVSVSLGVPPSGTQSVTLQMQGYFYQTYYVVDYIQLTASGVSQSQSPLVYTCGSTASPLSLGSSSNNNPGGKSAAAASTSGAFVGFAVAVVALVALLL